MKTKWLSFSEAEQAVNLSKVITLLKAGEVVAFPTETVYGLGADARNDQAIEKIFAAKGRPSDNPLIVHIASEAQLNDLAEDIPDYVSTLMKQFSPGPITYVLKSKGNVAQNVTAGLETIAIRIPNHPIALEILKQSALPIAAPSANTSGKPSPTRASHVRDDLAGKIACIVDGGETTVGLESTVVDCTGQTPLILRLGMVTEADIVKVVGKVDIHQAIASEHEQPKSPGLKYKHYAPAVPLVLIDGNSAKIQQVIDQHIAMKKNVGVLASSKFARKLVATSVIDIGATEREIAINLYDALRSFKESEVDIIVCESFPADGIGAAVMDRLRRAASEIM